MTSSYSKTDLAKSTCKFYSYLTWNNGALLKAWIESSPITFYEHSALEALIVTSLPTGVTPRLLYYVAQIEVESATDKNTLFRTDSILTKLFRIFSMQVCATAVKEALDETIHRIAQHTEKISKMTGKRYQKWLKTECWIIFEILCQIKLETLYKEALTTIIDAVGVKFPDTESSLVAAFYFLRFVCPLLVSAGTHFKIDAKIYPNAQRHLITI